MLPILIAAGLISVRLLAPAGALALAATAAAQSLAEVAKKEEARRKRITTPSRVYTDKDVKPADRPAPPAPAATDPAEAAGEATGADAAQTPPEGGGEAAQPGEDAGEPLTEEQEREQQEQQWRGRMAQARSSLERSQMFAEALQSRINALWADFTARDDPAQRAAIDAERKKALAQLDRVRADIVAQTKAIADIEEEARRAGIPPGWLR
jgi:hypothetical protein